MRGALLGALVLLGAVGAGAQTDTTAAAAPLGVAPDTASTPRSPRGAAVRSLAVPGWGQVYNREWVKAPVAAGLVAGAVVYAVVRQRQYLLYRRSAVYAGCEVQPGDPEASPDRFAFCEASRDAYLDEWVETGEPVFAQVQPVRDRARGQRDIAFLAVGVAYALQALDAYVAAELSGFDVSEDLSLRIVPTPDGAALAVRVGL